MASLILTGRAGSPGIGLGHLLPVGGNGTAASAASDVAATWRPDAEQARLDAALQEAADQLDALARQTTERAGAEVGAIFEAQALFARDPGITGPAATRIAAGSSAAEAILAATTEQADVLAAVDDAYFRERAADVRDVGRRVAAILRGEPRPDLWHHDGRPAIVVAHDLDPSAVATLRPELVTGIALAGGAPTGHAAIVARALGIPLVLGLGDAIDRLAPDVESAVDGSAGRLLIAPTAAEVADLRRDHADAVEAASAVLDTHGITIAANVASPAEAEQAARAGADGIGLVRTELLFLGRTTPPSIAEQRATYLRILAAMGDRPVVFRTLDVGGDKPAAWQDGPAEANPALGVRGLRLGLRRPALLDDQLEALALAGAGHDLRVMLPMVSTADEVVAARARLSAALERARAAGAEPPTRLALGVMIEVPSAALVADALAEVADFFSIGTNDLVQYTLAVDRTNPALADMASPLQPAVLRLIDGVVRAATATGRHVAVCGEAAADPSVVAVLLGLGVHELSVTPSAIGAVRQRVAGLDLDACRTLAARALTASTLGAVREVLEAG